MILNVEDGVTQKAEVKLKLINRHIGRTIEAKKLKIITGAGTVPFDLNASCVDFDSMNFQKSSMGKALFGLKRQINGFLLTAPHPLPLSGEVISVNPKEKEVVINAGRIHGIDFGDLFNVYAAVLQYKDLFTQRGVMRVKDVHESFSTAALVAGEAFEMDELARSRKTDPLHSKLTGEFPAKSAAPGNDSVKFWKSS